MNIIVFDKINNNRVQDERATFNASIYNKEGLMILNKLKGIQNVQERPKAQNMINTEKELQKYQVQVVSTDELMLSNADFHVKNLLTGFLEDIDEKGLGIDIMKEDSKSTKNLPKESSFLLSPREAQRPIITNSGSLLTVVNPKKEIKKSKSINFSPTTEQGSSIQRKAQYDSPIHRRKNGAKLFGNHKSSTINLVQMRNGTPQQNSKKPDLLNLISMNIEKNSLNLNNPELFYSEYFQKLVENQNYLKEEQNLYKRLLNTEKKLMDNFKPIEEGKEKESETVKEEEDDS